MHCRLAHRKFSPGIYKMILSSMDQVTELSTRFYEGKIFCHFVQFVTNIIDVYDRDCFLLKLNGMAKTFGWYTPKYDLKMHKDPGKHCMHSCQVAVPTEGLAPSALLKHLKKSYGFTTLPLTFLSPYDAMEHVAKTAYYSMKELTGGQDHEEDHKEEYD